MWGRPWQQPCWRVCYKLWILKRTAFPLSLYALVLCLVPQAHFSWAVTSCSALLAKHQSGQCANVRVLLRSPRLTQCTHPSTSCHARKLHYATQHKLSHKGALSTCVVLHSPKALGFYFGYILSNTRSSAGILCHLHSVHASYSWPSQRLHNRKSTSGRPIMLKRYKF